MMKFRILVLAILFYSPSLASEYISLPKDANGWTIFSPSTNTRIVYVSADGNNDTCVAYDHDDAAIGGDPFNPSGSITPCATYWTAKGKLTSGHPDWILFKRGDTFSGELLGVLNGESATKPSLIGAYGVGAMPVIKHGAGYGFRVQLASPGGGGLAQYFAVTSLKFYAQTRDPTNTEEFVNSSGANSFLLATYNAGNEIHSGLIEGCISLYAKENSVSGAVSSMILRRNLFLSSYPSSDKSQGLFSSGADGLILEENIFDHNGWYRTSAEDNDGLLGTATVLSHNTYFSSCKNVEFRRNIFMRGCNMNNKFTSSTGDSSNIVIDDNLYIDGHIGVGIGTNHPEIPNRFQDIVIKNNVITNLGETNITGQGIAWAFQLGGWRNGIVANNIIMRQIGELDANGSFPFYIWGGTTADIFGNVAYRNEDKSSVMLIGNLRSGFKFHDNIIQNPYSTALLVDVKSYPDMGSFANNKWYAAGGTYFKSDSIDYTPEQFFTLTSDSTSTFEQVTFPDPTRSIETYMASLGETATIDAFIAKARSQDRYNWDARYTADAVNDYIRSGFGMSEYTPPRRLSLGGRPIKLAEPGP